MMKELEKLLQTARMFSASASTAAGLEYDNSVNAIAMACLMLKAISSNTITEDVDRNEVLNQATTLERYVYNLATERDAGQFALHEWYIRIHTAIENVETALANASPERHRTSTQSVRDQVYALTNGRCAYCSGDLPGDWHVDHVVPTSCGGPDNLTNYVPACPACNSSKSDSHVLLFIRRQFPQRVEVRPALQVVQGQAEGSVSGVVGRLA